MAETDRPPPLKDSRSDGDITNGDRQDILTAADDIARDAPENAIDGGPDTLETGSEESRRNGAGLQPRATPKPTDGPVRSGSSAPATRSGRQRWIFPVIVGVSLISAGIGGGAVHLAEMRSRDGIGDMIEELKTGLARHEAGLIGLTARNDELQATLKTAESRIAGLQVALEAESNRIGELGADRPDGAAIAASLLELEDQGETVNAELARIDGAMSTLRARIENVEAQPIPMVALPEEIVNAYDRQLAEALGAIDGRFDEMREALDARITETEAAGEAAALSERDAKRAENMAAARMALTRMVSALNSGAAFSAELGRLRDKSGLEPPERLVAVADEGVPTRAELAATFPAAAREALDATTRDAVERGEIGPFRAFLLMRLGLRSLEPREGDSPDAILSRAETAVRAGDLGAALGEIATLPQVGRDRFADWIALAELRRDALEAVADLSARLDN